MTKGDDDQYQLRARYQALAARLERLENRVRILEEQVLPGFETAADCEEE